MSKKDELRNFLDSLFAEAPSIRQTVELKEEMLQNLCEKYDDLIAEGKSEQAAYNIVVSGVGDVSQLIEELKLHAQKQQEVESNMQPEELEKVRKRSALFVSIAVALYIACVVPMLILENTAGIVFMFLMVAAATGLLIYNNMTNPLKQQQDTLVGNFKQWTEESSQKKQVFKAISSALWAITVVIYILISFTTFMWHITWVIFLIAAAINSIIKAVFDLRK